MDYYSKYLKYKQKYINLQNQLGGVKTQCPLIGCSYLKRRNKGEPNQGDETHFIQFYHTEQNANITSASASVPAPPSFIGVKSQCRFPDCRNINRYVDAFTNNQPILDEDKNHIKRYSHSKVICPFKTDCSFFKRQNKGQSKYEDDIHFEVYYHREQDAEFSSASVPAPRPVTSQSQSVPAPKPVTSLSQSQSQSQSVRASVEPTDISILTYNILSQTLANEMERNSIKDGNPVYDPSYMNEVSRWSKISSYITDAIRSSTSKYLIICLQEVCESWIVRLRALFSFHGYFIFNDQYGSPFNGNFGALIACPNTCTVLNMEFYKVCQEQPNNSTITPDMLKQIKKNKNTAILLLLRDESANLNFGVVTYHMPRLNPNPDITSLNLAQTLYRKIIDFMGENCWVYVGDFNVLPNSPAYSFLQSRANCIWHDSFGRYPLKNNAVILTDVFSGCIDYMFYSTNLVCVPGSVIFREATTILPNSVEPSDHIPIIATFIKV